MTDSSASEDETSSPGAGFYLAPSWLALKQQITYLAQFGGGIQVVQGLAGAGKSTLQKILIDEKICADYFSISVRRDSEITHLLADLLWQLGLRPEQGSQLGELIVSLRAYVQSLHEEGERVVVAIDDAHYLADAALAALVSVLQGISASGIGLHFILFSEPGLPEKLDALQLLDVEIHDVSIPALSTSELEQLFFARGLGLDQPFEPELLANIWRKAHGLPGPALKILAESCNTSSKPPSGGKLPLLRFSWSGLPFGHIAALILLSGILVWAFLVRESGDVPKSEPQHEDLVLTVPLRATHSSSPPRSEALELRPASAEASADIGLGGTESNSSSDRERSASLVNRTNSEARSAIEIQSAPSSVSSSVLDATSEKTKREKLGEMVQGGSKIDGKSADFQAGTVEVTDQAGVNLVEVKAASEVSVVQQSSAMSRELRSSAAGVSQDRMTFQFAEKLLLSYPSDSYVLQIMAASDYERLREFVASQSNHQNLMIYRAKRKGRLLYILVEGFYADKESAQVAVSNLPSGQRKGKPWPKKIALIKRDIAEIR